jgi:hypothetical protein
MEAMILSMQGKSEADLDPRLKADNIIVTDFAVDTFFVDLRPHANIFRIVRRGLRVENMYWSKESVFKEVSRCHRNKDSDWESGIQNWWLDAESGKWSGTV